MILAFLIVSIADFHLSCILKRCAFWIFGASSVLYWEIQSINQHTKQEQGYTVDTIEQNYY